MSYSFYVDAGSDASLKQVLATLPYRDVKSDVSVPETGWPEYAHIHRDGISVRPVETSLEGDTVSVRIFSGASPDDYQLALQVIAKVSEKYRQQEQLPGLLVPALSGKNSLWWPYPVEWRFPLRKRCCRMDP